MNKTLFSALFIILMSLIIGCSSKSLVPTQTAVSATPMPPSPGWIMGFDASYATRVEDKGGVYKYPNGTTGDLFELLSYYEVDIIRLRVWHNPPEGYANKADMLALAKRAHQANMDILLDIHFSDSWADPSHQDKPTAWERLSFEEMKTAVYDYSAELVGDLIAQGTPPKIVQIGNEIGNGMLWPEGQLNRDDSSPNSNTKQWHQIAELLTASITGVKSTNSATKIMIHIAEGGKNQNKQGQWFFDNLTAKGVQFDIIGISYYPLWHGQLDVLEYNIRDLITRYEKPVIVVETSSMWTLDWNDWTHNVLGLKGQLHPGFSATPQGQQDFFQEVANTARTAGASGLFYWGGEWIATSPQDESGSLWENQALFDFNGKALPALEVYAEN